MSEPLPFLSALERPFSLSLRLPRVLFGDGCARELPQELERLGATRPFLVGTSRGVAALRQACPEANSYPAFAGARMHVPVEITEQALVALRQAKANAIVAYGGGSAIGLGKALAWRTGLPLLVVPTNYSGSEMTDFYGEKMGDSKRAVRDDRVLAKVVIYDQGETVGMPMSVTMTSGLNALAHGVETLYAVDGNPLLATIAETGIAHLADALDVLSRSPTDRTRRAGALFGSWLCAIGLSAVSMGLHHKLAHIIGGALDLPHAETHAVLLPYVVDFNAPAALCAVQRLKRALISDSPALRLQQLGWAGGTRRSLAALGMGVADIPRIAALALEAPYPNPTPLDSEGLVRLLTRAWRGVPLDNASH